MSVVVDNPVKKRVHKHINMMKLDHPQDYFIGLCQLISEKANTINI